MISPTLDSVRTALHLLGVAVWLGGQIVLAGIVPSLREIAPQATGAVARGFARLAWPALLLVVMTGVWGFMATDVSARDTSYSVTFGLKMLLVGAAVVATLIHSFGTTRLAKALGGAISLLATLVAAYLGVLLAHVG